MDEKDEYLIEKKLDVIDIKEAFKLICFTYQNKKYESGYELEKNIYLMIIPKKINEIEVNLNSNIMEF